MRRAKRLLDVTAASVGLVVLAPVFILLALAVKAGDGGPVLFRQVRVGWRGRHFEIIKFRTMHIAAEAKGGRLTVGDDPRITSIGRVLRRFKLDELPQLWNVVRGDMSLVGPRPEVPAFVRRYGPEQQRVLELVPGITDPASIRFRDESRLLAAAANPETTYVEMIMPEKVRMNLEYASRASLLSDLVQIARTVWRLFWLGPTRSL